MEGAFAWQARADLRLNLGLFRYGMNDIIRTADTGGGTARFDNVGAQHGRGLELDGHWDVTRQLRLSGNASLQRATEDATRTDAGYAPRRLLNARADWRAAGGWLLSGPLAGGWELAASVRNLFNADAREPSLAPGLGLPGDIPLARRSLYAQAVWRH